MAPGRFRAITGPPLTAMTVESVSPRYRVGWTARSGHQPGEPSTPAAVRCRIPPEDSAMETPRQGRVERRLAAILVADVSDCSVPSRILGHSGSIGFELEER